MANKIYKKEELQEKKMNKLREIGKEYNVNDNDKDELIDEILTAQDNIQHKELSKNAHDELIEEIKKKGIKDKDMILIEYPGQANVSNDNPTFYYEFNGKAVAVKKEHAKIILKNKDFKEAE